MYQMSYQKLKIFMKIIRNGYASLNLSTHTLLKLPSKQIVIKFLGSQRHWMLLKIITATFKF